MQNQLRIKDQISFSQHEFREIFHDGQFQHKYYEIVKAKVFRKLDFVFKVNKKKILLKNLKIDMICTTCKANASLAVDRDDLKNEPILMNFEGTCVHAASGKS